MKTFEEKWTAWLDDELSGSDLAAFEASLPDRAAAEAEKASARKLRFFLKRELSAAVLTNEEFFSHQLRERIAREEVSATPREGHSSNWWTVPRLLWSGALSLALFVFCAAWIMQDTEPMEQSQSLTQVLSQRLDPTAGPNATVTVFEAKEDRVTVLWTEGLKSLPSDYAAK
jgi:anti-sigma factor RsiW